METPAPATASSTASTTARPAHRIVKLKFPVSMGEPGREFTVSEIFFPEAHDLESWMLLEPIELAHAQGQSINYALLANITGHPYTLLRKIKLSDFKKFQPFLKEYQDEGNES